MKVYKITHNIDKCMKMHETTASRYFADKKAASELFMTFRNLVGEDEFVELAELEVINDCGEYKTISNESVAYFSDDTKFGHNEEGVIWQQ